MGIGYDIVLKSHAQVQDAKLFTKASQCRIGWEGSKIATKEDVEEAIKKEDHGKLLAIMPEATPLINRDELEHLPVLFDMLKQAKAITDCAHDFFPNKKESDVSESDKLLSFLLGKKSCAQSVTAFACFSMSKRTGRCSNSSRLMRSVASGMMVKSLP